MLPTGASIALNTLPRYATTGPLGPEAIDCGSVLADSPLAALRRIRAEAPRVQLIDEHLLIANPADLVLCAGRWRIAQCGMNGSARSVEIEIALPVGQAA